MDDSSALPSPDDVPRIDDMPMLGLGTWRNRGDECTETVRTALELGYRHVDTAARYENERAVGRGIATADVDREAVFVATKVWHDSLRYRDAIRSAERSLDRLGVEYLDLLYVHWPGPTYDPEETLSAFADLAADGLVDHVGVSNFTPRLLDEARRAVDIPIFANQVELHPLLPQPELREYCADADVALVAYSPLAKGQVFDVPAVVSVADRYDATPVQVALAWLREKGVGAVPKATSERHLRENLASLGLDLDEEAVSAIDAVSERRRLVDPSIAPW